MILLSLYNTYYIYMHIYFLFLRWRMWKCFSIILCVIPLLSVIVKEYKTSFFIFWQDWSLKTGPYTCYAGILSADPCSQSFLIYLYCAFCLRLALHLLPCWDHRYMPPYQACLLRWHLTSFFPRLLLNPNFLNIYVPSSCDFCHFNKKCLNDLCLSKSSEFKSPGNDTGKG